ncbi:hypothetical protein BRYFOR_08818 [Marvinbryantia formatexigens DSM 14469]|uniref:Uncharacterized protein n=1 Tax=Marvinbryantia formatexigens DSM 14469 TaxID=478749 RepID=C6LJI2_9FIRM|nr:hypothetical protein BRYFOR_08818 [Marvinbryantia formatexigens DSM 14469]
MGDIFRVKQAERSAGDGSALRCEPAGHRTGEDGIFQTVLAERRIRAGEAIRTALAGRRRDAGGGERSICRRQQKVGSGKQFSEERKNGFCQLPFLDAATAGMHTFGVFPALEKGVGALVIAKGRPAGGAFYHTGQPVTAGRRAAALPGCIFGIQTFLCQGKKLFGKKAFLRAVTFDAVPGDFADIKTIAQNIDDRARLKFSAAPGSNAALIERTRNGGGTQADDGKLEEDILHDFCFLRHNFKRLSASGSTVAKTGRALAAPAQRLFRHTAQYLAGQVDGIIFIHPFDNTFNQTAERALGKRLCDADDINAVLFFQHGFIDDGFLLVARKAAELPDQNYAKWRLFRLCHTNHALKLRAFFCFSAGNAIFNKNMLRRYPHMI